MLGDRGDIGGGGRSCTELEELRVGAGGGRSSAQKCERMASFSSAIVAKSRPPARFVSGKQTLAPPFHPGLANGLLSSAPTAAIA